jgi:O-antigen ligase
MQNLIDSYSKSKIFLNFILAVFVLSIPFKNAIYQASVILLIGFFVVDFLLNRKFEALLSVVKEAKFLAIGFSFIMLSMILANILNINYLDKKSWHLVYMFFFRYALVFMILAYYYKLEYFDKRYLIFLLYLSFSFLALTGVFSLMSMPSAVVEEGLKGTLDNRNAFGLFMGMGFVLSLLLFESKKVLSFSLMIIFATLMVFTFSRSSWVASVFASFVLLSLNFKKIKIYHLNYLLIFIAFIFAVYFSFDSIQQRFSQLLAGDSSGRLEIWQHTIVLIKEKIYFGHGLDTWMNLSDPFLKRYPDAHNMILEVLLSTGVLGLMAVSMAIASVLFEIYRSKNYKLFAVAAYFLVVTQFDFGAFGSKELLSFLTIFVFFVYSNKFEQRASLP